MTINLDVFKGQENEGRMNEFKPANELKPGMFVFMHEHGCKNDGGIKDIFSILDEWSPARRLCKIEAVISVDTDADLLNERFQNPAGGGNATDSVNTEEGEQIPWSNHDVIATTYTLCTVVISNESGRYLAFDAEGYDYNRYLILPSGYSDIWGAEIRAARDERAAKEAERERQHREEVDAMNAETLARFDKEFAGYDRAAMLKTTIKKFLAAHGLNIQVTQRRVYGGEYDIRIISPVESERNRARELVDELMNFQVLDYDGWRIDKFQSEFGRYAWINCESA